MSDPILRFASKVVLFIVIPTVFALIFLPEGLKFAVFPYLALVIFLLMKAMYEDSLFECPSCKSLFKPNFTDFVLSPSQAYFKLLRCPYCNEINWCLVKVFRGDVVDVKMKPIGEDLNANLEFPLAIVTFFYVFSLITSILNFNLITLLASTLIYSIYASVTLNAIVKGYRTRIIVILSHVMIVPLTILTFLGFVK